MAFRESQIIFGRRGATAIVSMQALGLSCRGRISRV